MRMPQNRIITAIDLGTEKCVTLIAGIDPQTQALRVMGVSATPSRGMKKSQIIDLEKVMETLTESLDAAERMAGQDVKSAYLSLSGVHVSSQNSKGVVAVASPEQEIVAQDVERVIEAARALSLPSDREIIHVIPKSFKVDSQEGIKDPVGMTGVRLEAEAHIITALTTTLKNLQKCVEDLGLTVDGFVFSGLAASEVVLSETEKELGVAVLDIGAGSTALSVYVDGSLEFSGSLPIGARHITQDIALGCRVSLDVAEKIKLSLTDDPFFALAPHSGESKKDYTERRKRADQLKLSDFSGTSSDEILSKRTIVEGIMLPRIQEIFTMVSNTLKDHHLVEAIPAGIVLTGGGAETIKIDEIAKRELNMAARIGVPQEIQGLTSDIKKASFVVSVGVLHYGAKHTDVQQPSGMAVGELFKNFRVGDLVGKITKAIKSLMP